MTPTEITDHVRADEAQMIDFLRAVVDQDSPSQSKEHCDKVGALFAGRARELGFSIELDPQPEYGDNIIARYPAAAADPGLRVLLVGHMDTVFETDTTAERPFRIEDGKAFGPGVFDMKSGIIVGLYAVKAALALAGEWRTPVTFVFNTDEEPGSPRSRDAIRRESASADIALIMEPGTAGPAVTIRRKGVGIFELRTTGRAAHAGVEPEKGVNAIIDLAARMQQAAALADPAAGTTVNVGVVTGGTQPYVVPAEASCRIDVRVPTLAEQRRVEEGLAAIAAAPGVPEARCELAGSFHRPPMEHGEESAKLLARLQAAAESVGYPLLANSSGGASDGNLTAAAGLPTIDGLGAQGGFAHRPDEYIDLSSLVGKASALAALLLDLNANPAL
jgi:glutamate carboxypeptidase